MNCSKIFALALLLALPSEKAAAETVIKFATLAPQGSTWMRVMDEFSAEVLAKTGGDVKFKTYAGGVQGDEKDVLRKIRLGQLHGGGMTGVGLGLIAPSVRVLDAPFLFKNTAEVDGIHAAFDPELRKYFEDGGYVLLGWAEVGLVYLYTAQRVEKPADLRSVKMWTWEGDPVAEAALRALDVSPIPLSVTDVMTSLQTGLINGVYGSPLSVIAMQWFTKTKYMLGVPITNASGAAVMSKQAFDKLKPEHQKILLDLGAKHFSRLTTLSREDNTKSVETLKKQGITVTTPDAQAQAAFESAGIKARQSLSGKLYTADLLDRMEKKLAQLRQGPAKKK